MLQEIYEKHKHGLLVFVSGAIFFSAFTHSAPVKSINLQTFFEELSSEGCKLPSGIQIPSAQEQDFPMKHLTICQKYNMSQHVGIEAAMLCQEIFDAFKNITCAQEYSANIQQINVEFKEEDICKEFASLKESVQGEIPKFQKQLSEDIFCNMICTDEFQSACQFLLWNYEVLQELRKSKEIPEDPHDSPDMDDERNADSGYMTAHMQPGLTVSGDSSHELAVKTVKKSDKPAENPANGAVTSSADTKSPNAATQDSKSTALSDKETTLKPGETQPITTKNQETETISVEEGETKPIETKGIAAKGPGQEMENLTLNTKQETKITTDNNQQNVMTSAGTNKEEKATTVEQNKTSIPDLETNQLDNKLETPSINSEAGKNIPNKIGQAEDISGADPKPKATTAIENDSKKEQAKAENGKEEAAAEKKNSSANVGQLSLVTVKAKTSAKQESEVQNLQTTVESSTKASGVDKAETKNKKIDQESKKVASELAKGAPITVAEAGIGSSIEPKLEDMEDDEMKPPIQDITDEYGDAVDGGIYDGNPIEHNQKLPEPETSKPVLPKVPVQPIEDDKPPGYSSVPGQNYVGQVSEDAMMAPFPAQEESHFFFYFLSMVLIFMVGYLILHNKQKIIALIVEGRHERRRRSHGAQYKKLDTK